MVLVDGRNRRSWGGQGAFADGNDYLAITSSPGIESRASISKPRRKGIAYLYVYSSDGSLTEQLVIEEKTRFLDRTIPKVNQICSTET